MQWECRARLFVVTSLSHGQVRITCQDLSTYEYVGVVSSSKVSPGVPHQHACGQDLGQVPFVEGDVIIFVT